MRMDANAIVTFTVDTSWMLVICMWLPMPLSRLFCTYLGCLYLHVDANAMVIASRQSASLAVQRQQHVMHVSSPSS